METWLIVLIIGLAVAALVVLGFAIRLLMKLVGVYKSLRDEEIPARDKAVFWVALAYSVWPVDVLPDPIYLDDIGALLLAINYLQKLRPGTDSADSADVADPVAPRTLKE